MLVSLETPSPPRLWLLWRCRTLGPGMSWNPPVVKKAARPLTLCPRAQWFKLQHVSGFLQSWFVPVNRLENRPLFLGLPRPTTRWAKGRKTTQNNMCITSDGCETSTLNRTVYNMLTVFVCPNSSPAGPAKQLRVPPHGGVPVRRHLQAGALELSLTPLGLHLFLGLIK